MSKHKIVGLVTLSVVALSYVFVAELGYKRGYKAADNEWMSAFVKSLYS